jgi:hypothetical protein
MYGVEGVTVKIKNELFSWIIALHSEKWKLDQSCAKLDNLIISEIDQYIPSHLFFLRSSHSILM